MFKHSDCIINVSTGTIEDFLDSLYGEWRDGVDFAWKLLESKNEVFSIYFLQSIFYVFPSILYVSERNMGNVFFISFYVILS